MPTSVSYGCYCSTVGWLEFYTCCFVCYWFCLSLLFFFFVFFFSSRRRHTRCLSDWSSDVCSSDLVAISLALGICADGCGFGGDGQRLRHRGSGGIGRIPGLTGRNSGRAGREDRSEERRVGKEWRSGGAAGG